jgi:hypothetical protein
MVNPSTHGTIITLLCMIAFCLGCDQTSRSPGVSPLVPKVIQGPQPEGGPKELTYELSLESISPPSPRPGESITVDFWLIIPPNEPAPSFVQLKVLGRGDVSYDSSPAELKDKQSDRELRFQGRLRAPKRPGRYTIAVEAIQTTIYTAGDEPTTKDLTFRGPLDTIRVKQEHHGEGHH